MKTIAKIILINLILFISLNIVGCNHIKEPATNSFFCFDTYITFTIYDCNGDFTPEEIINESINYCKVMESQLSKTIKNSDVSKINKSNDKKVSVFLPTYTLIKDSIKYSQLTNGAFDITVAPLVELWNVTSKNPNIPSEKDIKNTLENVNYKNIVLEENKDGMFVSSKNPNTTIDLGAIAKGYIADMLKDSWKEKGVTSAVIDLGGNILTIGSKDNKQNFKIGITKPFAENETDNIMATVEVKDKSVVTSGIYERYFKENDKIYHHIIDTKTGYPVDNELYSVTIISDSSEDGDALSTSLLSLGVDKGIKTLEKYDKDIEAIFITNEYQIIVTDGLSIDENNTIKLK